ncbi:hypothetical protein Tco_0760712 [Tanacetum coccineum]
MFVISQPLPVAPAADSNAQMKGYVDQLERLGYMLPQDLIVGLILNGLTKDFVGFRRNYNMHNMGKTIGKLHAILIEYEKGLPKKAETPQVMMIKGGKIQKANGLCFTNFGILVSKSNVHYFNAIPSNGTYEIDMHDLVPNVNSIYNVSTKRAKHNLDSTYLWHYRVAHINDKEIVSTSSERATDLLGIIHTDVCGPLRHVSRQGLVSKPVSQQPCIPPNRDDSDRLFQPMFDEYFNPPTITVSPVQEAAAPRAEVLADSPVLIFINQDAPSTSIPPS